MTDGGVADLLVTVGVGTGGTAGGDMGSGRSWVLTPHAAATAAVRTMIAITTCLMAVPP